VKLLGRYIAVRAEVVDVPVFSVHADQHELIEWLRGAPTPPEMTFVIHGEAAAAESLRSEIAKQLRFSAAAARQLEHVRIA
jgi:metallo-beta-lactamase family protein